MKISHLHLGSSQPIMLFSQAKKNTYSERYAWVLESVTSIHMIIGEAVTVFIFTNKWYLQIMLSNSNISLKI